MKRAVWVSLLVLLVVLSACNSEKASKEQEATDSQNSQETDKQKEGENEEEEKKDKEVEDTEENETKGQENTEDIPEAKYEVSDVWSIIPLDDEVNDEVALVTIDDAPDKHALDMAKTLKDLDVNAIFFVNGHFIESPEGKEKLKEIHDMGFLIGNHTYSHPFLPDLSEEEQKEEIVRVNDMVEDIIGERPKFFRAPNGANTDYTRKLAEEEGMILMNWSYGYDWEPAYQTKEAITDIMLHNEFLRNGANLLMHDREWTAAALSDIVKGLRDQGYELVDPKLIKTK